MTAAVADRHSTHIAYMIPLIGFVPLFLYGGVMWYIRSKKYNDGKLTIWIVQPPEAVITDAVAEVMGGAVEGQEPGRYAKKEPTQGPVSKHSEEGSVDEKGAVYEKENV